MQPELPSDMKEISSDAYEDASQSLNTFQDGFVRDRSCQKAKRENRLQGGGS